MPCASLFTPPDGLTEPLLVPEYGNPPSLFGLVPSTGFDVESLTFSYGIGGVGAVLYDVVTGRRPGVRTGPVPLEELLFAFGFGTSWSGVYAHVARHRVRKPAGSRD